MSFAIRSLFLCTALSLGATVLPAQTPPDATGRIVGRILDESTGAPIAGAQVGIAAGGARVSSGMDGRYTLLGMAAGPVALAIRAIGYSPKTVSGITVPAGGVAGQDIVLAPQTVQLMEISVEAAAERGSVNAALEEQRNAAGVVNSVTAEQIARSPDGDAAQAVQRVSGVTVQDGRYVFVRGLGERYTTTSLNNARIPSPEPERKVVPLDLFPSNLLEAVTTSKTFSPDQPGDFSGAQVNLRTREFPLGRTATMSLSSGFSDAVMGQRVLQPPSAGREWLGFGSAARRLPAAAVSAGDLTGLSQSQLSSVIGAFRNQWSAGSGTGGLNSGFSASVGGEDPVWRHLVGYVASFTYASSTDVRRNEERAIAVTGDAPGTARPQNQYRGESATGSVLWGGMLNLSTRLGATSRLAVNNTYTRSADNAATRLSGFNEEFATDWVITRLAYTERTVRSHQITGQHLLAVRHQFDWAATFSAVTRDEPDRSDLIYDAVPGSNGAVVPRAWFGLGRSGTRTFSALNESSRDLSASWRVELGATRRTAVKVGVSRRTVRRDADARAYNILNLDLSDSARAAAPEQIFASPSHLTLAADANVGRYAADDAVNAGYAMIELPLGDRIRAIGGARVEQWEMDLTTRTATGIPLAVQRRNTDVLPSVSLTWRVRNNQNLRLAASQTLSRPEYRELAPIGTRDIAGGLDFFGDSGLQRALIRNFDLRWEWYPSGAEIVSVGVFAKQFLHPIERILVGSTGATTATFANAEQASNLGLELEVRRGLGLVDRRLQAFTVIANATLMRSTITPGNSAIASQSSTDRPMVGQAGYVINAGLAYVSRTGATSATLLYNVVGRRISEAGTVLLPDAYEEGRQMVDLSLRFPGFGGTAIKVDARNLLDSPYRITQGSVIRHRYSTGRTLGLGISWNP